LTTMIAVNLMPTWRRQQLRRRARRRLWTIVASIYALALALMCVSWRMAWADDDCDISQQLALVRGDIEATENVIAQLRGEVRKRQMSLQVSDSIAGQPDWSILLALVAKLREDDVVLNRCDLDTGGRPATALLGAPSASPLLFHVQGFGRTQAAVSHFALRLEHTGLFQSVTLLKSNREPFLSSEAVAFRIECVLKIETDSKPAATPRSLAGVSTAEGTER
jgi:Tfp pilus assembly protein PilN